MTGRRRIATVILVLWSVAVSTIASVGAAPFALAASVEAMVPAYVGAPPLIVGATYSSNMPDPAVVYDGSTYWAYTTSTGGPMLPVLSSTDLRTWTARSDAAHDAYRRRPSWALSSTTSQWAPGVFRLGSEWLVYTSWSVTAGRRCISVAVASSPAGPFIDTTTTPIVCDDGDGSIDPAPYRSSDGTPYLVWKSEAAPGRPTMISAQRLAADGRSLVGPRAVLLQSTGSWEKWNVENPSMTFLDGTWWLLYSGATWDSPDYRMGVARCEGPLGPCTRTSGGPLIGSTAAYLAPGGGSFFTDAFGRTRIAYHAWNAPYTAYPSNPNCDGNGSCTSQGQRYLRLETVRTERDGLGSSPFGSVDAVVGGAGSVSVSGWAIDPSLDGPTTVHLYVDGQGYAVAANGSRPDVGAAFPGYGAAHGYSMTVPAGGGAHDVCAYALNVEGGGSHQLLGCRTVTVPGGSPIGSVDAVVGGAGSVTVSGWVIDPDTAASTSVHVYVDGRWGDVFPANGSRPDVGAVFPGYGASHGFSGVVTVSGGTHSVCVYGIDIAGSNPHSFLGCRTVTVR